MGLFGRLALLGKGMWKVKRRPDPDFSEALEKELEHITTEQERARARARLDQIKGGEEAPPESPSASSEEAEPEAPKPSLENPPKKTL